MPNYLDDFICEVQSDELIPDWWDEDELDPENIDDLHE